MKRFFLWFAAFMAVIGLAAAYGLSQEPDWYVRARYPLHFEQIVRVHADNYDLDPALVAAVIYAESKFDPDDALQRRRRRPHAAAAGDGAGHRRPHRRRRTTPRPTSPTPTSTCATGAGTCATCAPSTATPATRRGWRWPRTTRDRRNVDKWIAATPKGEQVEIPFPETRAYIDRVMHLRDLYRRAYNL